MRPEFGRTQYLVVLVTWGDDHIGGAVLFGRGSFDLNDEQSVWLLSTDESKVQESDTLKATGSL
jgi:hypothetical protein